MAETPDPGSPIGRLLESARTNGLHITGREAARRAGISPTRWREVVAGRPTGARVLVSMALAVGVDPAEALQTAGVEVEPEHLAVLLEDIHRSAAAREPVSDDAMAVEIERISALPISADARRRMIKALVDVYTEAVNEARTSPKTA
jgi:hypothetical protein